MRRYQLGTSHAHNIGQPAIIEHPQGEYMLVADHLKELAIARAETEFWRLKALRERERNANTIT